MNTSSPETGPRIKTTIVLPKHLHKRVHLALVQDEAGALNPLVVDLLEQWLDDRDRAAAAAAPAPALAPIPAPAPAPIPLPVRPPVVRTIPSRPGLPPTEIVKTAGGSLLPRIPRTGGQA